MIALDPRAEAAGVRLLAHDEIGSTNAEALRQMRAGDRGPLWVTAARQTQGRGRRGRTWVSPAGNLYASLLLTDPSPPGQWPQISFVAALALHDAIVAVAPPLGPRLALKWPNDLLLSGAKLAGILVEGEGGETGGVVIGIGVNCASHPDGLDYPTIDLAAAGAPASPGTLLAALSLKMMGRLAQWNRGEFFTTIRADWLARAAGLGQDVRVRLAEREIAGRFEALDEAGCLVVNGPGGREVVCAGDLIAFSAYLPLAGAKRGD